jgi:hypothetical protein
MIVPIASQRAGRTLEFGLYRDGDHNLDLGQGKTSTMMRMVVVVMGPSLARVAPISPLCPIHAWSVELQAHLVRRSKPSAS